MPDHPRVWQRQRPPQTPTQQRWTTTGFQGGTIIRSRRCSHPCSDRIMARAAASRWNDDLVCLLRRFCCRPRTITPRMSPCWGNSRSTCPSGAPAPCGCCTPTGTCACYHRRRIPTSRGGGDWESRGLIVVQIPPNAQCVLIRMLDIPLNT